MPPGGDGAASCRSTCTEAAEEESGAAERKIGQGLSFGVLIPSFGPSGKKFLDFFYISTNIEI
jgi:hypothetical protein